ncbi:glycerate kinase [Aerococcaceae bacterium DSM 111021]|nr:glycerate kinase [Aerococcaceae bacterium DSM 111021]
MINKILLAPDSFKGSLTALEVCKAMEEGIRRVLPDVDIVQVPMADGGEGTVQSLVDATNGELLKAKVTGPLGNPVTATYGVLGDGKTGVIEMAEASGLHHVNALTQNPLVTTTYGTGELIVELINRGITQIILGLGGSATNDGGAGMAQALGYELLKFDGSPIEFGGGALDQLDRIGVEQVHPKLKDVTFIVASDVNNPLCGPDGASSVFGPQKGATAEMIDILNANLKYYARVIKRDIGRDVIHLPGAGAAGGLGAGLLAFTQAELKRGIDIVIEYSDFKAKAKGVDLCLTGEGAMDFQTKFGKTPYGVAQAMNEVSPKAKVIAVVGKIGEGIEELYSEGIDAVFGTAPGASTLEALVEDAGVNVSRTVENVVRTIR